MSETNKEIEKLDEVNVAAKDAAPAETTHLKNCLLYTSPSPRDGLLSRMPSSA